MKPLPTVTAVVAGLVFVACGNGDDEGGSSATTDVAATDAAGGAVSVTLQEYSIITDADSIAAGEITFNVDNIGPDDVHAFAIVRTDFPANALPTLDDKTADEGAEGIEVIEETADLAVGESATVTASLEPGAYALICNVFEAAENEAHYDVGMHTGFTVE